MEHLVLPSLLHPLFFAAFGYFIVVVFVALTIPGSLLLKPLRCDLLSRLALSTAIGIAMWVTQETIFGYLHIRYASYAYITVTTVLWLHSKNWHTLFRPSWYKLLHDVPWSSLALITVGSLLQMIPFIRSGFLTPKGLAFCCPIDTLWHLSLTNQIIQRFPPFNPGLDGQVLINYHYSSNIFVAGLVRVFSLPLLYTQWQYVPLLTALLLGLLSIAFARSIHLSRQFLHWLLFFVYFGEDATFIFTSLLGHGPHWESLPLEDGAQFLINIPKAISLILLFAGITLILYWIRGRGLKIGVLAAFLLGSIVGFKTHTGLFSIVAVTSLTIFYVMKRRFDIVPLATIFFLIFTATYLPPNHSAGGLYVSWFWRVEEFAKLPIFAFDQKALEALSFITKKNRLITMDIQVIISTLITEFLLLALYIAAIFGTKLIALGQNQRSLIKFPIELHVFLLPALLGSLSLGLFTLQTSGVGHTYNFVTITFVISSLYAALSCSSIFNRLSPFKRHIMVGIILYITLIRYAHVVTLLLDSTGKKSFYVSPPEMAALAYLSQSTPVGSRILVDPAHPTDQIVPYIGLLAQRPVFFSGKFLLDGNNTPYAEKQTIAQEIFTTTDEGRLRQLLKDNRIDYLYLRREMAPSKTMLKLKTTYQNGEIIIRSIQ